jgi:hypothetical protein
VRSGGIRSRVSEATARCSAGMRHTHGSRASAEAVAHRRVQAVDAAVVEAARHRAEHRQGLVGHAVRDLAVAPDLLADVAERVLAALVLELVDRHQVGEIQHLDLLELARRPVLGRHHVQTQIREPRDLGVALPDPRGLDDHQIVARTLDQAHHVVGRARQLDPGLPGRQAAHVHVRVAQRVHADAIAEQRPAGAPTRRIDGHHRDVTIGVVAQQTTEQLVGQRALARAAGAGDAEHRHPATSPAARRAADRAPRAAPRPR